MSAVDDHAMPGQDARPSLACRRFDSREEAVLNYLELNKIAGAGLGTLLLAMSLNLISASIFSHAKLVKSAYPLPSAQEAAASGNGMPMPSITPIEQRLAGADVKKGEADSKPCQSCHNFEKGAGIKIGPPLYGVVGRAKGSVQGFDYSDAIQSKGGKWTYAALDQFLADPRGYAPGTKMTFAGESDPAKRADIIGYLHTLSDNPEPLPMVSQAVSAITPGTETPLPQHREQAVEDISTPSSAGSQARSASTTAAQPAHAEPEAHTAAIKPAHRTRRSSHKRK